MWLRMEQQAAERQAAKEKVIFEKAYRANAFTFDAQVKACVEEERRCRSSRSK
jgi:hypothetical protein